MDSKKPATKEEILESAPPKTPGDLPGMVGDGVAKPNIEALNEAVGEYVVHRDARLAAGLEEKTNKKLVLALMEKHKLGSYEVDDMVVVRKPKDETESIKVVSKADYTGTKTPGGDGEGE